MVKQRRRSGHGAQRWRRLESGEPTVQGGGEFGLGRRRVHGKSNLGVEVRRISPARGAPWWHGSGGKLPVAAGRRSGGESQLGGRGAAVSSGGGRGGEGSLGEWSEWPFHTATLVGQGSERRPSLR
jgi:hypothetical protein